MKKALIGTGFVIASLVVWGFSGCGKTSTNCDAVFEHVRSLAPADMRDVFDGGREQMLTKCQKLTTEQRTCILNARDLGEVSECKRT